VVQTIPKLRNKMEITKKQIMKLMSMLDTRIQTINDRTKIHTLDIRKIERRLKELENEK